MKTNWSPHRLSIVITTLLLASLAQATVTDLTRLVFINSTVSENPPRITLSWNDSSETTGYTLYRKKRDDRLWGAPRSELSRGTVQYADSDIQIGQAYEYRVVRTGIGSSGPYKVEGYIYAGVRVAAAENRGRLILLVDSRFTDSLTRELGRLEMDLIGDGWTVIRRDVDSQDSVPNIKSLIQSIYQESPSNTKSIFLFGHIPVPYSGFLAPDGHGDHIGAWPADVFYADIDGQWTDLENPTNTAIRAMNRNIPYDGKFDQSSLPSDVELQVGRVDLSNLSAFLPMTEENLLRQYLDKDHAFRHNKMSVQRKGLIDDNIGYGFDASAWHDFSTFFGRSQIIEGDFFSAAASQRYLWGHVNAFGGYDVLYGVGTTADFKQDPKIVFNQLFGSYLGDWDSFNNILRAPLCTSMGLTSAWVGRPGWRFHHMALGEPIGFSAMATQNNGGIGPYQDLSNYGRQIHVALMGDPTLRLHPVTSPEVVTPKISGNTVLLTWPAFPDSGVIGHNVYYATEKIGPYTKLTPSPIAHSSWTHTTTGPGAHYYMVRTVKLETSNSGSYLNLSQGTFAKAVIEESPDVAIPTVKIFSPAPDATIYKTVEIRGTATDSVGLAHVEMFVNSTRVLNASEIPQSIRFTPSSKGLHSLMLKASDNYGNTASDTIAFNVTSQNDTEAPSVWIETPGALETVYGNVVVTAHAQDNDGIEKVDLYINNVRIQTDTTEPYSFVWIATTASPSNTALRVVATDLSGNTTEQHLNVTVLNSPKPTVYVSDPYEYSAVHQQIVNIQYNFEGPAANTPTLVFTHVVDNLGNIVLSDYHLPPVPSQQWTDKISYTAPLQIPASVTPGLYKITTGLYDNLTRYQFNAGPDVVAEPAHRRYQIGTLIVNPDTTAPTFTVAGLTAPVVMSRDIVVKASDDVWVDSVRFSVDGTLIGEVSATTFDNKNPRTFTIPYVWSSTSVSNGNHTFTVAVKDTVGNISSQDFPVVVSNPMVHKANPAEININMTGALIINHNWSGGPLASGSSFRVALINTVTNTSTYTVTYNPNPAPQSWTGGPISTQQTIDLSNGIGFGTYNLYVQLRGPTGLSQPMSMGTGITAHPTTPNWYKIATIVSTTTDSTPPLVSNIATAVFASSATISWSTNELADSQVEFGTTSALGQFTILNSTRSTQHQFTLTALRPATEISFRLRNRDTHGNLGLSSINTITTKPSTSIPIVHMASPPSITTEPGKTIAVHHHFEGDTHYRNLLLYAHFVDSAGAISFYDSYTPPIPFSEWTGHIRYTRQVLVPQNIKAGVYRIMVGAYTGSSGYSFTPGPGVIPENWSLRYQIGTVTVTVDTSSPSISNLAFTAFVSSAALTWTTSEVSDSVVEYGSTTALGLTLPLISTKSLTHDRILVALKPSATTYFRVLNRDAAGNQTASAVQPLFTRPSVSMPTLLVSTPTVITGDAGEFVHINTRWQGDTLYRNILIFTHIVSTTGAIVMVDSYAPPVPFENWTSTVLSYERRLQIPPATAAGTYKIYVGLYAGLPRYPVIPGPGVITEPGGTLRYEVGSLVVRRDDVAPLISGLTSIPHITSATIRWVTNEPSDSQVEFGPTLSYGFQSPVNLSAVINHQIIVSSLAPLTLYNVRVKSKDNFGNIAISSNAVFTTGYSTPTVYLAIPGTLNAQPGGQVTINHNWSGGPTTVAREFRLAIVNATTLKAATILSYTPTPSTLQWTGAPLTTQQLITLPANIPAGAYRVFVRMVDNNGIGIPMNTGPGVIPYAASPTYYEIAQLAVSAPAMAAASVSLHRGLTLNEIQKDEFDSPNNNVEPSKGLELLNLPNILDERRSSLIQIGYKLEAPSQIHIVVIDRMGNPIKTILDQYKNSGSHEHVWDGRNESGEMVAPGVYSVRVTSGSQSLMKKVVVIR